MSYIGNTATTQAFTPAIDYFNGNGSTTAFTLSKPVASVAQVQVVVNNVAQNPASAYSVSSNTITFTSAPSSGTNNIYVYYTSPITQVIQPGQNTVYPSSLSTTNALYWDTSGNVGIGTTSPGTLGLQVTKGAGVQAGVAITNPASSWAIRCGASTNYLDFTDQAAGERMRIDSSGNVLIGTTTAQTGAVLAVTGGIQGTIKSGTSVASTSGTSIDYTNIPSWVKRITVMFNGVSTNGTSKILVRIGTGGTPTTSGYVSQTSAIYTAVATNTETSGFQIYYDTATFTISGSILIQNITGNAWVMNGSGACPTGTAFTWVSGGNVTLGGVLNFLRITTLNGTDTFDAGTVNIMYEG